MDRRQFLLSILGGGAILAGAGKVLGSKEGDDTFGSDAGTEGRSVRHGEPGSRIKIVGLGDGGGDMLSTLRWLPLTEAQCADYLYINTDHFSLELLTDRGTDARKLFIGKTVTAGRGSGGDSLLGRQAALDSGEAIRSALRGAGMVVIMAGLGGGTGSGAAPVIAGIARDLGALSVSVVTTPFAFEGAMRNSRALDALADLRATSDGVICVQNDRVLGGHRGHPLSNVFATASCMVGTLANDLACSVAPPSGIALDAADLRALFREGSEVYAGTGDGRLSQGGLGAAARTASQFPLITVGVLSAASSALVVVSGGETMRLADVDAALTKIKKRMPDDADIYFAPILDPKMHDECRVTIYAIEGRAGSRKTWKA